MLCQLNASFVFVFIVELNEKEECIFIDLVTAFGYVIEIGNLSYLTLLKFILWNLFSFALDSVESLLTIEYSFD